MMKLSPDSVAFDFAGGLYVIPPERWHHHQPDIWNCCAPRPSPPIEQIVEAAMLDAWNDICADTGCHPLDIEQLGQRRLEFTPRQE
jgi:hypothetical protein